MLEALIQFYESDLFTITLEIIFLIFIIYDIRRYMITRKKEYITNIVLTLGFAVWAFIPFYNKYFTWEESDRAQLIETCMKEHDSSYCECIDDKIFKEYDQADFNSLDQANDKDYLTFIAEMEDECSE